MYPEEKIGLFVVMIDAGETPTSHRGRPPIKWTFQVASFRAAGFDEGFVQDRETRWPSWAFLATADVKDCFHSMKTPKWMHPFFSLAPVHAQVPSVVGKMVEGVSLEKYG